MKRYIKNKDFISEKFYNKVQLSIRKKEDYIIILILIVNLSLIPNTSKKIAVVKEKASISNINQIETKSEKNNLNNILIWIENIFNEETVEAYISNNSGNIVMNDLDGIDKISKHKLFKINEVIRDSNGKYKLGVSLNE